MNRKIALLAIVFTSFFCRAQQDVQSKVDELRQDLSRPIREWTDPFIDKTFQQYLDLYVQDVLWDQDFHKKVHQYLPTKSPKVTVLVAGELRTPYTAANEIFVPAEYLGYLGNVSMLLAHDVYGDEHYISVPRPLLSTPFRTSQIAPLLSPLYPSLENPGFMGMQTYLKCPAEDKECTTVQAAAGSALMLFMLAHEMAHQALHHQVANEGLNLEQELAADRYANAVLSEFIQEYGRTTRSNSKPPDEEDLTTELRQVSKFSPIFWLRIEASREDLSNVVAQAREKALLDVLSEEERSKIEEILNTEESDHNVRRLTITSTEPPDTLLIDGVDVSPPASVLGQEMLFTAGLHRIVAIRSGRMAIATAYSSDTRVSLFFLPLKEFDERAAKSAVAKKDWNALLLLTSDEKLLPRTNEAGQYHWEALHHLGLDSHIQVENWQAIPANQRRTYLSWENRGELLYAWYLGSATR